MFIDGIAKDKTPTVVRNIPDGEHVLRVEADRYFPFEDTISIEGLDREQTIKIELVPAWANVTITTEPDAADIFVDEERLGQTPLTTEILEGKHAIRIKKPDYKVWQDEIIVTAGEAMDLGNIKLELADAVVFLVSNPPRANITVDGDYKGLTPLQLTLTPGKQSTIRLFKQGYMPASRKITAKLGDQQRLNINLKPELVTVEFNVKPADAKLYIDGKLRGTAKQTLQLSAKTHNIEIRKEGFVVHKTKITPHIGIAQQVNVALKTLRQAKLEKVKPFITTSTGESLKLFYPTKLKLKLKLSSKSQRWPPRNAVETFPNPPTRTPAGPAPHPGPANFELVRSSRTSWARRPISTRCRSSD